MCKCANQVWLIAIDISPMACSDSQYHAGDSFSPHPEQYLEILSRHLAAKLASRYRTRLSTQKDTHLHVFPNISWEWASIGVIPYKSWWHNQTQESYVIVVNYAYRNPILIGCRRIGTFTRRLQSWGGYSHASTGLRMYTQLHL